MNIKSEYHYLNEFGVLQGLDKKFLNGEKKTFFVLDSSVCLDIINIVNKRNVNKESKRKAFELIKHAKKESIQIFEIFALLELSLDKSTYKLNTDKFIDFGNKLKFAFEFPLERLKRRDFNFLTNFYLAEKPNINNNVDAFIEQLLVFYSALLKIREIALKGLSRKRSNDNIIEFIDWMNSELGVILGIEYQLALQIFGGNSRLNTMIKEKSSKEKSLKTLWGTAWDLLHARVSRNSRQLSEIIGEEINAIFITNDKKLFELLSPQIEFTTEYDRSKLSMTDGKESYPPYFEDSFMEELNERMIFFFKERNLNTPNYPNKEYIKALIEKLENVT